MGNQQQELLKEIKRLKEENRELRARKKYGLVWEDSPEELDSNEIIPVLKEIKEKRLELDDGGEVNYLLEGDNYHSLKVLQHTHKGKVDVIYIDPPYNTGNEFVYNDKIVDKEDSFRHSKWLSFMSKRLKLAKNLLSDDGVIFVSIDDNEQAQLKLLMDSIFGEKNFVENMMWMHGKGKKTRHTRTMQQYTLVYSKNRDIMGEWKELYMPEYAFTNKDSKGEWFSGSISFSESRSNKNSKNYYTIESPSGKKWTRQWQVSRSEMGNLLVEGDIYFGEPPHYSGVPRRKIRREYKNIIPVNILDKKGTTKSAINELSNVMGKEGLFDYPKPTELIKHFIQIVNKDNPLVLDFFAGSGTTGQAVMELNKEDGGNRKFILCTNNEVSEKKVIEHFIKEGLLDKNTKTSFNKFKEENGDLVEEFMESGAYKELGIARSVTYERNRKVIEGYTTPKGEEIEGIPSNLRYLETVAYSRDSITNPLIREGLFDEVKVLHEMVYPTTDYDNYYLQMYGEIKIQKGDKPITVLLGGNEAENELIVNMLREQGHTEIIYRAIEHYI